MRKASLSFWVAITLVGGTLVGCGDDPVVGGDDAGTSDSGGDVDASTTPECAEDAECDDGNACNGTETCAAGACVAGTASADGTECDSDGDETTAELCVMGACGATRCGDSYVDATASEECDDGNDVDGDGCDDCRFSCDDAADCSDGVECNGAETCSAAHVCEAGTALAEGAECAGGTGTCMSGTCLADSCTVAADCDDANVCNGTETCDIATGCALGTALDCDDENACTADSCHMAAGCRNTLIDADLDGFAPETAGECGLDCDDTRADVNPDAPDVCDAVDNDCDGMVDEGGVTTWYADCDADGYAASGATTISSCARPAVGMSMCASGGGWTTRAPAAGATDCNDANATVNPGQMMFQTTAIAGAAAASDYDYDCDAMEEVRTGGTGSCARAGLGCAATMGWAADAVPACGATEDFVVRCEGGGLSACTPVTEERQQACR
ncbi:MAG: putative metal-binding motif-containing protein [Myxococcota bacterium]|nr:putative metal-binding motif-containing protein [Myxococcota bacterium]